jgi:RNA polymerase sigma-70 factor (ECF subfamily)
LYWPPVYAFYRCSGRDRETAKDLTQGLFLHLIERDDIAKASPERGRFRSYLRTCARHFAANRHRAETAAKRGGASRVLSLDLDDAEEMLGMEAVDRETPERAFERNFAQALVGAVHEQLAAEFAERDRHELFAGLRCYLEVDGGPGFAASAAALGMTEGAVKVAVHRMRKRFRDLLVAEVRQTLADPDEAADEIEQLLAALRGPDRDSQEQP